MSAPLFWVAVSVAILVVIFLSIVLLIPGEGHKGSQAAADVSISAAEGSIVTVRKVGRTTRVVIRSDIHDHWEGSEGIDLSPVPIEITKQEEPELFAEYMSPKTSALRKYEIADYIYSLGLTLPYIHGLHEKWQKEKEDAADAPVNPATEPTPVNPRGGRMKEGIVYNRLDINHKLRVEPLSDDVTDEELPEAVQEEPENADEYED